VTLARELGYRGEGGQVAEIVADDHHVAGAGLGDDPADRVAFVAAHRRPQLPDQLPRDDLEGVLPGDFPGGLVDRAGPLAGVGEPAGVDGDRVLLILQPSAAVAHGRGVSQRLSGGQNRRPRRLQAQVHPELPFADLLQPVQT
jgi:hypothetical protein